jgi:hypothetical protein
LLKYLHGNGVRISVLARAAGLSRQRVHQIVKEPK